MSKRMFWLYMGLVGVFATYVVWTLYANWPAFVAWRAKPITEMTCGTFLSLMLAMMWFLSLLRRR